MAQSPLFVGDELASHLCAIELSRLTKKPENSADLRSPKSASSLNDSSNKKTTACRRTKSCSNPWPVSRSAAANPAPATSSFLVKLKLCL